MNQGGLCKLLFSIPYFHPHSSYSHSIRLRLFVFISMENHTVKCQIESSFEMHCSWATQGEKVHLQKYIYSKQCFAYFFFISVKTFGHYLIAFVIGGIWPLISFFYLTAELYIFFHSLLLHRDQLSPAFFTCAKFLLHFTFRAQNPTTASRVEFWELRCHSC